VTETNRITCVRLCGFWNGQSKRYCEKIENSVPGADTYCEISFTEDAGRLAPGGSTGTIPFRIEGAAEYDQTDDIPIILKCQMILGITPRLLLI